MPADGAPVAGVTGPQRIHRMRYPQIRSLPPQITANLEQTPNIPTEDRPHVGCQDICDLAMSQALSHLALAQVITTRSAAADLRLVERHQLQARNHLQQLARLLADLLRVTEMASIVVHSLHRQRMVRLDRPQGHQKLTD